MTSTEENGGGVDDSAAGPNNNDPDSEYPPSDSASIGSNQPENNDETPTPHPHSHRPADVALKQQRMKSWQPLLDPKWVITCYLMIGIIFIPTGE